MIKAVDNSALSVDNSDPKLIWDQCLSIIKKNVNPQSFQTWFTPIIPVKIVNNTLTIKVPNQFFYEWIEEHYPDTIRSALKTVLGENSDPVYNFPENVGAYAGRFSISRGKINITSEYAHKFNDPSYDNEFIFKDGQAISTNISYSQKGLGILVGLMSLDNMSFRSERSATINDVNINYLPTITKTHTYSLAAMYPFSSQPNGQIGLNTEIFYKLKRKFLLQEFAVKPDRFYDNAI